MLSGLGLRLLNRNFLGVWGGGGGAGILALQQELPVDFPVSPCICVRLVGMLEEHLPLILQRALKLS